MSKPLFKPASPKQALMLKAVLENDIIVIGGAAGSGKSYILNALPYLFIDDPLTNCIMFRRTNPQLKGGLWPNAKKFAKQLPKHLQPHIRLQDMEMLFPKKEGKKVVYDGARIKYQQAENVEKSKDDAQGQEFTFIGVDEATQFTGCQLEYFMSRLRSPSKHHSRMVMSCNPDPDHYLRSLIDWYLDEDGLPNPKKDGITRWFVTRNDTKYWADSKEELLEKFGEDSNPLRFTFVSGTIYDNPIMIKDNPSYLAMLEGLNDVDKAQLLHGNWNARPKGQSYAQRDWFVETDHYPDDAAHARSYDLAASERTQVNKFPDATTAVGWAKSRDGIYYMYGNYHEEFVDEETGCMGRMLKRVGERDNIMRKQAQMDGVETIIVLPVDPAAAGKQVYTEMAKKFAKWGFAVKKDPVPNNKNKLNRFLPFADALENGLIRILKHTFDPVTYNFIMSELEKFDGTRSTSYRKDDFPDCIASGYNYLCTAKIRRKYKMSGCPNSTTKLAAHKKSIQ